MEITRQADYALRAVLEIARHDSRDRVTTAEIARRQQIPASFLAKIVGQLSIAGILQTTRGARGGVTLARDPAGITMLDVVEAIDGPIVLNACVTDPDYCTFGSTCAMRPVWCEAHGELVDRLRNVTMGSLIPEFLESTASASSG